MRTSLISEEQLSGLRLLTDEAADLEQKARYHIQLMARNFDGENSVGGLPKFKVTEKASGRILGHLSSQFGEGRFVLDFRTQEKAVRGSIVVEKQILDKNDAPTWEPVMLIPLPNPLWQVDGKPVRPEDRLYMLSASILHAIVNGTSES